MRFLITPIAFCIVIISNLSKVERQALAQDSPATAPKVPALIVFGDSIMDPGNNNDINTIVKCNFPPYGIDFNGGKPTGRFSNGKIPSDLLASKLGLKEDLPAYVGANLAPEDLITGVSFASGGAGYDPLTSKVASAISLDQQLELFKAYKEKVRAITGEDRAATVFSESLYIVCIGSDDVANTYFPTPLRKRTYDVPSYANLLVGFASEFVQKLIKMGAKKIGVVGIPPIGCVPSQRTLGGGIFRACATPQNQLATLFNSRVSTEIQRIKTKFPGTRLVLADIYGILYDIIQRPKNYGLEISAKGCCGTGKLEVSVLCNSLTSSVCSNVSKYVFWDSYHPTEKTYKVLVDFLYEKYIPQLI
ncbi:uncharacterized protein A4U43_C04F20780 [Asparagus officinalis]|uniref:GDSL esterase/lipase EXL3 n=1 Tax=Asparagus officinalis TaxID=4686 RepID=A0A5P1F773_ASPOF|nr:GDSL esterase/lipase EXL3-like isoform X2 [Asparagus officinalis]ONK72569.1 uncharacterized protein A4U43_C04F20780 [Asparagus officinalis]